MEPVRVVMRFADGRLIKGYTNDFFPNKPMFHVRPSESELTDKGVEVLTKELKAVFFVKDFTGDAAYNEKKDFMDDQHPTGRKVEVRFADGEVLVGSTLGYDPNRIGFFVTPADPRSNSLRVFVISASASKVLYL